MGDGGFSWCLGALEGLVVFVWGDCCFAMVGAGRRPAPTIVAVHGPFANGPYEWRASLMSWGVAGGRVGFLYPGR